MKKHPALVYMEQEIVCKHKAMGWSIEQIATYYCVSECYVRSLLETARNSGNCGNRKESTATVLPCASSTGYGHVRTYRAN